MRWKWNMNVPNDRVKVEVQDGMIILTGEVDWEYQRAAAHDAVCCLIGIKELLTKSVSNRR